MAMTTNEVRAVRWRGHPCAAAVDRVCARWAGTRYGSGRVRGASANCVQLVAGVLEELMGREVGLTVVPNLRGDVGLHDTGLAGGTVRAMVEGFDLSAVSWVEGGLEPGDLVVVRGEPGAGAAHRGGHVGLCTGVPWRVFHTTSGGDGGGRGFRGAGFTTLAALPAVVKVYRPAGKGAWS